MDEQHWYAVYTRSRHEKAVYADLQRCDVQSFLPLRKARHQWSDRTVTVEEPLFAGYVFVRLNPQDMMDVLTIRGVVCVISSGTVPIAIEESVMTSLQTLLREELTIDPYPYLHNGDCVTVRRGPLKGVSGYILRRDTKKCRLVISIDAIGASASVEIAASNVEKVF